MRRCGCASPCWRSPSSRSAGRRRPPGPPPLRVLFVGNSLTATNDLPGMVAALGKGVAVPRRRGAHDRSRRLVARGSLAARRGAACARVAALGRDRPPAGPVGAAGEPGQPAHVGDADSGRSARARTRPALFTVWPESYRFAVFADVLASYRNAARAARAELLRPATRGALRGGATRSSRSTARTVPPEPARELSRGGRDLRRARESVAGWAPATLGLREARTRAPGRSGRGPPPHLQRLRTGAEGRRRRGPLVPRSGSTTTSASGAGERSCSGRGRECSSRRSR